MWTSKLCMISGDFHKHLFDKCEIFTCLHKSTLCRGDRSIKRLMRETLLHISSLSKLWHQEYCASGKMVFFSCECNHLALCLRTYPKYAVIVRISPSLTFSKHSVFRLLWICFEQGGQNCWVVTEQLYFGNEVSMSYVTAAAAALSSILF